MKYCSIWLLFLHYCPICMSYIFVKCCGEVLRFPCHHCLSKASSIEVEKIFKDFQHNITRKTTQGQFMYEPQRKKKHKSYKKCSSVSFCFFSSSHAQDGVEVVKSGKESCVISSKRPSKNSNKPLLYGRFVKVFNICFWILFLILCLGLVKAFHSWGKPMSMCNFCQPRQDIAYQKSKGFNNFFHKWLLKAWQVAVSRKVLTDWTDLQWVSQVVVYHW